MIRLSSFVCTAAVAGMLVAAPHLAYGRGADMEQPFAEWKAKYQKEASAEQQAAFQTSHKH